MKIKKQKLFWESFIKQYKNHVKEIFHKFEVELIVYDEVEYFYDHDHGSFNYPYVNRKDYLSFWKFDPFLEQDENGQYLDYSYSRNTVQF